MSTKKIFQIFFIAIKKPRPKEHGGKVKSPRGTQCSSSPGYGTVTVPPCPQEKAALSSDSRCPLPGFCMVKAESWGCVIL